eukprot:10955635-Lingulodinium_polyedra.AAC.1
MGRAAQQHLEEVRRHGRQRCDPEQQVRQRQPPRPRRSQHAAPALQRAAQDHVLGGAPHELARGHPPPGSLVGRQGLFQGVVLRPHARRGLRVQCPVRHLREGLEVVNAPQ